MDSTPEQHDVNVSPQDLRAFLMASNRYFFVNVFLLKELLAANKEGKPMFAGKKDKAKFIPQYVLPLLLWMLSMQQRKKDIYISAATWSRWTGLRVTTVYSAFKWLNTYGFRSTRRFQKKNNDGSTQMTTMSEFNVDPLRDWLNKRTEDDPELRNIIVDSYKDDNRKQQPEGSLRGMNICFSLEAMKAFRRKTGQQRGRTVKTNFTAFLIWSWALTKAAIREEHDEIISIKKSTLTQILHTNFYAVDRAMKWLVKEGLLVPQTELGPKYFTVALTDKLAKKIFDIRESIAKANAGIDPYSVVRSTVVSTANATPVQVADDGKNFDDSPMPITLDA